MKADKFSRFIFLDIDGVMNSIPSWDWDGQIPIESSKVELLNNILDSVKNCGIVISSSWRSWNSLQVFKIEFRKAGFEYSDHIIGKTPERRDSNRSKEIKKWLEDKTYDSYLAIDDRTLSCINSHKTESSKGLTLSDAKKIIKYMNDEN